MSTILKTAPLGRSGAPLASRPSLGSPSHWHDAARRAMLLPVRLLMAWQQRIHDREVLRQMTEAQLKDIGIGSIEALQEADKPFWRA